MKTDKPFRPMLADTAPDMDALKYPLYVSPKLDGVRCLIRGGVAVTRNLKPVPNKHVQHLLAGLPDGIDGELIVGQVTAPDVFTRTQSAVMSASGAPAVKFHVFDWVSDLPFVLRWRQLMQHFAKDGQWDDVVRVVSQVHVQNWEQLSLIETRQVEAGYEGVMVRSPSSPYKFGRSTVREGYLLKIKRFMDDEATVIGFEELMINRNVATVNALGLQERSTKKDGTVPGNTLGALVCEWNGIRFGIGTGFTAAQREAFWISRNEIKGRAVKFKFQGTASDGAPRFPVFLGWRDAADLDGAEDAA